MKNRRLMIVCIIIVTLLIIVLGFFLLRQTQDTAVTSVDKDSRVIEYGTKDFDVTSLIEHSEGTIMELPHVDTTSTGKQTLVFFVQVGNKTRSYECVVEIKDTAGPLITLKQDTLQITTDDTFDPLDNISAVDDPVDGPIPYKEKNSIGKNDQNYYTYESDIDTQTAGSYQVRVFASDQHGVTSEKTFQVDVTEHAANVPLPLPSPRDGDIKEPTYIKGILIVNKSYGLPRNYGETDPTAYANLQTLQEAANAAGHDIPLLSGYRPYETQVELYNAYIARDGQAAADRYSARPGFSEHQSGLCFDIGSIDDTYGDTPAGQWLAENAHLYGYIIRYPKGKEGITGYMYEPWHVRYVGVDVATAIYTNNATLEEYVGLA